MGKLSVYRLDKAKYDEIKSQGSIDYDGLYVIKDINELRFGDKLKGEEVTVSVNGKTVTINGHEVKLDYATSGEVVQIMSEKADADGIYPLMTVGNILAKDTDAVKDEDASFVYRTTGGSASLSDGSAKLMKVSGNVSDNGYAFTAGELKSVGFNAFDASDATSILYGYELQSDGSIIEKTGSKIAIARVVKGVSGTGENNGYDITFESGYTPTTGTYAYVGSTQDRLGWTSEKPTGTVASGVSIISRATHGNSESYLPVNDGYLLMNASTDVNFNKTCMHICWSGYRDEDFEKYSESTVQIPYSSVHTWGLGRAGNITDNIYLTEGYAERNVDRITFNGDTTSLKNWVETSTESEGVTVYTYTSNTIADKVDTSTSQITVNGMDSAFTVNIVGSNVSVYTGTVKIADITNPVEFNGAILYYKLANPVTVSLSSTYLYNVSDFGTEEFVNYSDEIVSPWKVSISYLPNLIDSLRALVNADLITRVTTLEGTIDGLDTRLTKMEKISIGSASSIPVFSTATAYEKDSLCWYPDEEGYVYRFTQTHAAGPWTIEDVCQTSLLEEYYRIQFDTTAEENVKVYVEKRDKSSVSSYQGVTVTMYVAGSLISGDGTVYTATTDSNGIATFNNRLSKGTQYSISFGFMSGYRTPSTKWFKARLNNRYVSATYLNNSLTSYTFPSENRFYIVDTDGNFYKEDEWEPSGTATAYGIYGQSVDGITVFFRLDDVIDKTTTPVSVKTGTKIHKEKWASAQYYFPNVPTETVLANAIKHINGEVDMRTIISDAADVGAQNGVTITTPAATYCMSQTVTFGGVTYTGRLGAGGEMYFIVSNNESIKALLYKIYGAASLNITINNMWTATQYSAANAWGTNGTSLNGYNVSGKTYSNAVLPLFDLNLHP